MSELSGAGDRAGKLTETSGRRVDLGRRRPIPECITEAVMTEWVQMLVTLADGPRQPVHGVVVPYRNSDEPFHYYYGSYGEEPVFLPVRLPGVHLYRWGHRSRIESLDGQGCSSATAPPLGTSPPTQTIRAAPNSTRCTRPARADTSRSPRALSIGSATIIHARQGR